MVVSEKPSFLSGVVEGFYGRPWTCGQRKELFMRMKKSGMNTYVYAPKDDTKHRALWRQLYSSEEEAKIQELVKSAGEHGITFVYAISPGLDIIFSSSADIAALKRKMKQVMKLGCKAFALLFDDIDPRLRAPDSNIYKSSAEAQSSLTNDLHHYLKTQRFLFCPTEYCRTRALPSVTKSEYLNTIGASLHPDIEILWTGNKVIPETISVESIDELRKVLRRKPVIWDNIHANDYDHRRVFLGPYQGRPLELYNSLNGILTNPNCEFEANFVPVHTLGTWCRIAGSKYRSGSVASDQVDGSDLDDVLMEDMDVTEGEGMCPMNVDLFPLTAADVSSVVTSYDPKYALRLAVKDWLDEFNVPKAAPHKTYAKRLCNQTTVENQTVLSSSYQFDTSDTLPGESIISDGKRCKDSSVTDDDIYLLVDLFNLPYGFGEKGQQLIEEFQWLKDNKLRPDAMKEKSEQWREKAVKFRSHCEDVLNMFRNLSTCANQSLLYDLYPYIWDVKEAVLALCNFVSWLAECPNANVHMGHETEVGVAQSDGLTSLDAVLHEDFMEPWHPKYLGGIALAMLRLLPFEGSLSFLDIAPDSPMSGLYNVRPYTCHDKASLYRLCNAITSSDTLIDVEKEDMVGDKQVGAYLAICPETVFVIEHENEMEGFVAVALDNKRFHSQFKSVWEPEMNKKYLDGDDLNTGFASSCDWYPLRTSHFFIKLLPRVEKAKILRRVLATTFSILKSVGSAAVYCEVESDSEVETYGKLGFHSIDCGTSQKIVGRCL